MTTDLITPRLVAEFRATLGDRLFTMPGNTAPLGLHWCLASPLADTVDLRADGHPPRVHPVSVADFPRRMWVGGGLDLVAPLQVGQTVIRTTTLLPTVMKSGVSGNWCLTGADHDYTADGALLVRERHDIAFRPASRGPVVTPPPQPLPDGDLVWEMATPETLLFRYSALTFNGHRIHYDQPYATRVEGYPGLVVHGPLQATLLLNLAATLLGRAPAAFSYRATAPLIAGTAMVAIGRHRRDGVALSIHTPNDVMTMTATAS